MVGWFLDRVLLTPTSRAHDLARRCRKSSDWTNYVVPTLEQRLRCLLVVEHLRAGIESHQSPAAADRIRRLLLGLPGMDDGRPLRVHATYSDKDFHDRPNQFLDVLETLEKVFHSRAIVAVDEAGTLPV
ncbi:unnamed protein product [Amoebophrya sp. A25]|nr:unnamed protein product [Amoebophrya sp. A25]|eukprot:GSA25T00024899001.1